MRGNMDIAQLGLESQRHLAASSRMFTTLDDRWSAALGERPSRGDLSALTPHPPTALSGVAVPSSSSTSRRKNNTHSSRFGVVAKHRLLRCHQADEGLIEDCHTSDTDHVEPLRCHDDGTKLSGHLKALSSTNFDERFFRLAIIAEEDDQRVGLQLLLPLYVGRARMKTIPASAYEEGAACLRPGSQLAPRVRTGHLRYDNLANLHTTTNINSHHDDMDCTEPSPSPPQDHDHPDISWNAAPGRLPHDVPSSRPVTTLAALDTDAQRQLVVHPRFPDDATLHDALHAAELRLALTMATTRENVVRCASHETFIRSYIEFETQTIMFPLFALEAQAHHSLIAVWQEEIYGRGLLTAQLLLLRLEESARLAIEGLCWSCRLSNTAETIDVDVTNAADAMVADIIAQAPLHRQQPLTSKLSGNTRHQRRLVRPPTLPRVSEAALYGWRRTYCPCLDIDVEVRLYLSGIHLPADPKATCSYAAMVLSSRSCVEQELLDEGAALVQQCLFEWQLLMEWCAASEREFELEVRDRQRIHDYAAHEYRRVAIEEELRLAVLRDVTAHLRVTHLVGEAVDEAVSEIAAAGATMDEATSTQQFDEEEHAQQALCDTIAAAADTITDQPSALVASLRDQRQLPMSFALFCRLCELEYTETVCRRLTFDIAHNYLPQLLVGCEDLESPSRCEIQVAEATAWMALSFPSDGIDGGHETAALGVEDVHRHMLMGEEALQREALTNTMAASHFRCLADEATRERWNVGCVAAALVAGRSSPSPREGSPSPRRSASPAGQSRCPSPSSPTSFREPSHFLHWEQQRRNQVSLLEMQVFILITSLSRVVLRQIAAESLLRGSTSMDWGAAADEAGAAIARAHDLRGLCRVEDSDRCRIVAAHGFHLQHLQEQSQLECSLIQGVDVLAQQAGEEAACLCLCLDEAVSRVAVVTDELQEGNIFHIQLVAPRRTTSSDLDVIPSQRGADDFARQLLTSLSRNDIMDLELARIAFL